MGDTDKRCDRRLARLALLGPCAQMDGEASGGAAAMMDAELRRRWTQADVTLLRSCVTLASGMADLARVLDRSEGDVATMIGRLNLRLCSEAPLFTSNAGQSDV